MELPNAESLKDALKQKILAGEPVPLDDLKKFILASSQTLEKQKKESIKPTDVDFF